MSIPPVPPNRKHEALFHRTRVFHPTSLDLRCETLPMKLYEVVHIDGGETIVPSGMLD